jgi:hypothetical protein
MGTWCFGDVDDHVMALWKLADYIVIHYDLHAFVMGMHNI